MSFAKVSFATVLLAAVLAATAAGCDDGTAPVDGGPGVEGDGGVEDGGAAPGDDAGPSGECASGPLELPIPGCSPARRPSTGDLVQDCVDRINQLRWECQCLPPLERWTDGEACADEHAQYDGEGAGAHGGFRDGICSPGGNGQNECPGYSSEAQVIGLCLQQMWDEGPGEPFEEHGHYLNMTDPRFGRVACGFYTTATGDVWAVQNFAP